MIEYVELIVMKSGKRRCSLWQENVRFVENKNNLVIPFPSLIEEVIKAGPLTFVE